MKLVFADTAFYVALLSRRDALHARAVDFLAEFSGQVVTTEFILVEVANFNSRPADRTPFVDLLSQIRSDPHTQLIPASSELLVRGVDLFSRRPDKHWSLTDCMSFVVMTDRGLKEALTSDETSRRPASEHCLLSEANGAATVACLTKKADRQSRRVLLR